MSHRRKSQSFAGLPRSDVDEVKRFQKYVEKRAAGDLSGGETAQYLGLSDEQFARIKALREKPR